MKGFNLGLATGIITPLNQYFREDCKMPGKSTDKIAEESLSLRLEMNRLMIEEKLSESKSLIKVLPKDINRKSKLKTWIKHGLWPMEGSTSVQIPKNKPIDIMPSLTPEMVASLVNAANKLAEIEEQKLKEPTYRPRFKGKRRSTSVRLPILLEDAALAKARENGDANLTGNTRGGLTDLLFWRYLDSDTSFLGEPGQD